MAESHSLTTCIGKCFFKQERIIAPYKYKTATTPQKMYRRVMLCNLTWIEVSASSWITNGFGQRYRFALVRKDIDLQQGPQRKDIDLQQETFWGSIDQHDESALGCILTVCWIAVLSKADFRNRDGTQLATYKGKKGIWRHKICNLCVCSWSYLSGKTAYLYLNRPENV